MFDFVIIGAGPVGTYLAHNLCNQGFKTCILDHTEIGKPVKCSGHVSKEMFNFIPYNKKLIENIIHGARFHFNGHTHTFSRTEPFSYVIDRTKFDKLIVNLARSSGCKIIEEKFVDFVREEDSITVRTNKNEYNTKILVGCDGPHSDVRLKSDIEEPEEMLTGLFTYIDNNTKTEKNVDVFHDVVDDFFAWRIPRKGKYELGLATGKNESIKRKFNGFCNRFDVVPNEIYGGKIPIGPPKTTIDDRIFLVGDAAAQVKPFTGGGIIYGLTAATLASKTIDPDVPKTLERYENMWRSKLITEIKLGEIIRKSYTLPVPLKEKMFNALKLLPKSVQMDQPKTILKEIL